MAGAPLGNTNALKGKIWNDTLRKAIVQDDRNRLWRAAQSLLDQASQGEQWAIKELADRLDGKSVQSNTLESNGENQVTEIIVSWVSPKTVLTLDSDC